MFVAMGKIVLLALYFATIIGIGFLFGLGILYFLDFLMF